MRSLRYKYQLKQTTATTSKLHSEENRLRTSQPYY